MDFGVGGGVGGEFAWVAREDGDFVAGVEGLREKGEAGGALSNALGCVRFPEID